MAHRGTDWFEQAKRDLEHAENDLKSGYYEWACFSAQQACEKAVKSVFYMLNADAWGHAVTKLLGVLAKHFPIDEAVIKAAKNLDKLYIPSRYPNGFDEGKPADYFTMDDAQRAITDARLILEFCESKLSQR